jgi:copper chaperone
MILKFKTNINCGGCKAKVTPFLDQLNGIKKWEVDLDNSDKVLTVEANEITPEEVSGTVEKAGFKAEKIDG